MYLKRSFRFTPDELAEVLFGHTDPAAMLHDQAGHELSLGAREAEFSIALPLADKATIDVKHAGLDLVVKVDGNRRTIALPPALADYRPAGASFADGVLMWKYLKAFWYRYKL